MPGYIKLRIETEKYRNCSIKRTVMKEINEYYHSFKLPMYLYFFIFNQKFQKHRRIYFRTLKIVHFIKNKTKYIYCSTNQFLKNRIKKTFNSKNIEFKIENLKYISIFSQIKFFFFL